MNFAQQFGHWIIADRRRAVAILGLLAFICVVGVLIIVFVVWKPFASAEPTPTGMPTVSRSLPLYQVRSPRRKRASTQSGFSFLSAGMKWSAVSSLLNGPAKAEAEPAAERAAAPAPAS